MEGLDLDNILDDNELSLFNDVGSTTEEDSVEEEPTKKENKKTTEVDPDTLFGEPESVGSDDEENNEVEDTFEDSQSASPRNPEFFSSIAEAFAEEGILPNLDEETIKNIKTPQDFRDAINEYIQSELTEQQRRIQQAMDNGVAPNIIKQHEAVLNYLDSLDEDYLSQEENEQAEIDRKRLIYQDFVNRGFSPERATKEVEKSLKNGTEIQDAIEALKGNKEFIAGRYQALLDEANARAEHAKKATIERANQVINKIQDPKFKFFDTISPDTKTRKKIAESILKPIAKDEQGNQYTAVQKYMKENPEEANMMLGFFYTMTDGFKNLDKLISQEVRKKVKKGFSELENKLNNTSRDIYGNLTYATNYDDNAYIGKGIKLNL